MDSSGYNQQEHQQQQQQQSYDPSQIQAYDHSSQYYYAYDHQYQQQYPYYAYDPSQAHADSYAQQPQHQFQQEPTSVHPPGVPIAPEPAHSAGTGQMQNQQLNPVQGAAVAGSVNPEAMAVVAGALAQLTHYAGNSDQAQHAMQAWIGPSHYRGRGRRGGRPFRGGGRGRFNHRGQAPYRGRGRGLGGGGHFPPHSSGPAISNVAYPPAAAGSTSVAQPSSLDSGQIPLPNPTPVPAAPSHLPPRMAWCEICKVECNTPEVLEQHKNGKRHKKNLLVHEELQRIKAINGQQSGQASSSQLNSTIQPEQVQESTENVSPDATVDNHNNEIELQTNGEASEVPAEEPEVNPQINSDVRGHGFKRKMRGGRGGKYLRINDGSRRPVEPPKPTLFICELCNVKCESQVVYDSHLMGKKHLSSLKRVHGHQALYGAGLQTLQPPNINALSNSTNVQVQQGVSDPQVLLAQLLMTVLSQVQGPAAAPVGPAAAQTQAPISLAGSSYEQPVFQNLSQGQASESTAYVEGENPTGETKNMLLSVPLELDPNASSSTNTKTADASSETEEQVLKLPQDSSVMKPAETPVAAKNKVASECEAPPS